MPKYTFKQLIADWQKDLLREAEICEDLAATLEAVPNKKYTKKGLLKFASQCKKEAEEIKAIWQRQSKKSS